jgi:aspartyl-tRNA(Asn)/glutamyl-tRNA(Gln) amidotransferase subunit B
MATVNEFEAVIGLEVHCQLSTASKIFCGCRARLPDGHSVADVAVNSNTCPICAGHPGTLPVLNRKVVEYAIRAGVALNCSINPAPVFARKNYFYPDLPKGYQISQYDLPICENGSLDIGARKIRIQRIHMEEDAGKNVHMSGFSLVNLNRAGVPLIEIVSAPDLRTAAEAGAYLRALHAVVTYLEICDGNMQEGNFRCDANVSVRPVGTTEFGTRTEIKNVNSFRFVEKAIEYEIARQIEVVKAGKKVVQETRTYDSARNVTISMRSKEEAQDYRYFPDPDLIPVQVDTAWIEAIRGRLPELPEQRKNRYVAQWALPVADAEVVTGSKAMAEFFEKTLAELQGRTGGARLEPSVAAKPVANWLTGEVARLLNEEGVELSDSRITPRHLADVVSLLQSQVISSTGAKQVISTVWKSGLDVDKIVEKEGLKQVSDTSALEPVVDKVIAAHPNQVAEFKAGKEKLLGFFVGQIMKETGGKANPSMLQELIRKRLG